MTTIRSIGVFVVLVCAIGGCRSPSDGRQAADASAPAAGTRASGVRTRIGDHHHPIATTNAEAQAFFDQGFALVYGFNHEEAERSFARAAERDPRAAMPHWGIAWAVGPNYNLDVDDARAKRAYEAIQQARALAATGPPQERAYVEALAVRYARNPHADRATLARRYSAAMRRLVRQFPDDLDAATLYAESLMNLRPWRLWTLDGRPAPETEEIVSTLESVLRRDPHHLGANHYYIHAVEASRNPARALASAARLESLAPAAGHLVHMPAHIYARTGDHAGAARANLAGAEADRVYLKDAPPDSFYAMAYFSHNLHFLADSHMMQGRFADARAAAIELAQRLAPHAAMMPMAESMIVAPMSVLLRFGRHDDVLGTPKPATDRPVMTAWWYFARGVALARTGRVDAASQARRELERAAAAVPKSALFGGTGLESARTILSLAGIVLDARIAWARGEHDRAIALWARAVTAVDRVPYDEPPIWFYPVRESLGAALLLADKPADAERVFREDLERNPRNPRSLFGLRETLVKLGRTADAAWVQRQFEQAWKNADTALSVEGL